MKEWGWLCQKGGSLHQVPKSSLCLWTAVRENEPYLLPGIYWAPTRCSECSIPFVRRRLHPFLFLTNLRLFEMETGGDLVFYQDKESKMWTGIMKKIYTYFRIRRNPRIYKHRRLWGVTKAMVNWVPLSFYLCPGLTRIQCWTPGGVWNEHQRWEAEGIKTRLPPLLFWRLSWRSFQIYEIEPIQE